MKRAFTLLEILLVVAGVLAMLFIPYGQSYIKKSQDAANQETLNYPPLNAPGV